jgi:hypothetical protein
MKYKCPICEREIDDFAGLAHAKAEEYIIELIKKDHPDWAKGDRACKKCIEYYRKLVKENEI